MIKKMILLNKVNIGGTVTSLRRIILKEPYKNDVYGIDLLWLWSLYLLDVISTI